MAAGWSLLQNNSYKWPQELSPGSYKKAEKTGKIKKLLDELAKGEKFMKDLDPPYQWVTTNPVTHLNWQKLALKFMEGGSKKLADHLGTIRSEAEKGRRDKAVAADKDSKEACDRIVKSAEAHLKMIQPGAIRKEVDELNKLFGEAREEFLEKKTGESVSSARGLAGKGSAAIAAARKKLVAASKTDDPEDALEEIREQMGDVAKEMIEAVVPLIKARQDKLEIKGLGNSEYAMLPKIASGLKPYAGNADWTGKLDIKTMAPRLDTLLKIATAYDGVCKRMTG